MRSGRVITEEDRRRARELIKRVDAKIKRKMNGLEPIYFGRWHGNYASEDLCRWRRTKAKRASP